MRISSIVLPVLIGAVWFTGPCAQAQTREVTLGYLGVEGGVNMGFLGPDGGMDLRNLGLGNGVNKAVDAVRMAVKELNRLGRYYRVRFKLAEAQGGDGKTLLAGLEGLSRRHIRFVIADLPGELLRRVVEATANRDLLLFNVAAIDDDLRGKACAAQLFHVIPSRAMLADGLAQYLMKRNWRRWLLIVGPRPRDRAFRKALERAARRFGAVIVDTRVWKDNADMRRSAEAEFPLFTARAKYDVVVVSDEEARFAYSLPYHTHLPRPVVGTQGLTPRAWFWGLSQWGATQLNARFIKASGRRMIDNDWAAWSAVTAIGEAVAKGGAVNAKEVAAYLLRNEAALQGYKGFSLSFRPWNRQLRQPILLTTPRVRISVSPQEGFLHPKTVLDTLGIDQPENRCQP